MNLNDEGVPPLMFVQLLESQALDSDAAARLRNIMAREGTNEAMLIQHDVQAPIRWFREVYPELDVDQATLLGFTFAEQAQLTSFGPLSFPLVSAGSVAEIVELLTYLPLISTALSPQFHPSDHGLTVGLTAHTSDLALDCLVVAYSGSVLLRLLAMLAGDMPTVTLHLSWPAPTSLTHHKDVLAGRLCFDAPTSFLYIPADTLNEVCRFSDPLAYRLAIVDLQRTLDQRSRTTSFSEKVRRLLEQHSGQRGSHWVAHELSISASTLKRRLAEEGTTFRELHQSFLRERAMLQLLDQSMSVSEIATDLGYSDLTNFSHAFKRWTGRSPSEFRHT
ncbi:MULTISPECIES: helix-turn-helix transcriptional regulator [Mycobacteriales]|uniref:AraC family transcriptional regulator n=3 Tax=Mycobacteriales TaxID=85007 RepID=A0A7V8LU26_9MYCO|nr:MULTISPECIES: helix-turn-helix domain-containing protein [Mycobacteriales]AMT73415.1 AraC family transcriptional regulator [Mycobacteroides immunogenum]ANO06581.1 AraC family transcriptional regulator [Mycobacteroides immunogenum]KIU39939.1 AraC family transcriptional regulator [Mycobacteroides immunogenum]KPG10919.1 AraC family transcriptional regulator [Mycobacteroides immunogenum]KPG13055.1 AraC family transcriptional regulator [Mycobacteroides immunogenum]